MKNKQELVINIRNWSLRQDSNSRAADYKSAGVGFTQLTGNDLSSEYRLSHQL